MGVYSGEKRVTGDRDSEGEERVVKVGGDDEGLRGKGREGKADQQSTGGKKEQEIREGDGRGEKKGPLRLVHSQYH